ncbi:MAG: hypothetical protein WC795_03365 [Candidatus Paceibacterota bacterium]|jgi:hypothetical protein
MAKVIVVAPDLHAVIDNKLCKFPRIYEKQIENWKKENKNWKKAADKTFKELGLKTYYGETGIGKFLSDLKKQQELNDAND